MNITELTISQDTVGVPVALTQETLYVLASIAGAVFVKVVVRAVKKFLLPPETAPSDLSPDTPVSPSSQTRTTLLCPNSNCCTFVADAHHRARMAYRESRRKMDLSDPAGPPNPGDLPLDPVAENKC